MPADPSKPCAEQPCTRPRAAGQTVCAHHRRRKRARSPERGDRGDLAGIEGEDDLPNRPPLRVVPPSRNVPSDEQIIAFHARIAAGLGSERDNEVAVAAERSARLVLTYREAHRGAGEGKAGRSVIEETLKAHGTAGVDEINAMVDAADQQAADGAATEAG